MGLTSIAQATYLNGGLGIRVPRGIFNDAAGPTNLFTIAGGLVLVTGLYGVVTTVRTGGGATQIFAHTSGAAPLCAATLMAAATAGTVFTITGDPGDFLIIGVGIGANTFLPLQGGMKGSGGGGMNMFGVIMGVGSITTTISIATTGATRYVCTYIPIDEGATLRAV